MTTESTAAGTASAPTERSTPKGEHRPGPLARLSSLRGRHPALPPIVLLDLVIVGVAVAATLWTTRGKFLMLDANFDMKYYHAYLGWSLFHDGVHDDLHPAGVGSYLNPALDALNYLAMSVLDARVGTLLLLVVQLSCVLPSYLIARLLMPGWRRSFALASGVLSLGGALVTSEWGTTFGDLTSAPLVLWGLYLLLSATRRSNWRLMVAGLLLGVAVGVKLTNGPYGVAAGVMAVFLLPRLLPLLRLGLGMLVGFLVAAGPWMLVMWRDTDNPVFPLFNNYFQSPYAQSVMQADGRFGARGFGDALMLPFKLVNAPAGFSSELPSSDWRWPLWAVSVVLLLVVLLLQLPGSSLQRASMPSTWRWREDSFRRLVALQLFLVVAFLLWARIFGIQRYAMVIELLTVPAILALLSLLTSRLAGLTVLTVVLAAGLGWNTVTLNWGRIPMPDGPAIPVGSVTTLQKYGTVIVAETQPSAYVAVATGGDTPDGTRPVWLGQPYTETDRERGLDRMAPGRVGILVRADAGDPVGPAKQAADWYHLRATGTCDPVAVPLGDPMLICEVAP
jgi:hypothetical protein